MSSARFSHICEVLDNSRSLNKQIARWSHLNECCGIRRATGSSAGDRKRRGRDRLNLPNRHLDKNEIRDIAEIVADHFAGLSEPSSVGISSATVG